MDRRSALLRPRDLLVVTFVAIVFALALAVPALATAPPPDTVPAGSSGDVTVDTANPFIPEERDLTECIGMLQRPGCGSEARGGWHQNAVAIAMIGGLVIIFGRVAYGVRKNRLRSQTPS